MDKRKFQKKSITAHLLFFGICGILYSPGREIFFYLCKADPEVVMQLFVVVCWGPIEILNRVTRELMYIYRHPSPWAAWSDGAATRLFCGFSLK
jgi:hypothetical protein